MKPSEIISIKSRDYKDHIHRQQIEWRNKQAKRIERMVQKIMGKEFAKFGTRRGEYFVVGTVTFTTDCWTKLAVLKPDGDKYSIYSPRDLEFYLEWNPKESVDEVPSQEWDKETAI